MVISLVTTGGDTAASILNMSSWWLTKVFCFIQIITELVETCRNHDFTDIVVVHEHRGEPDGLVVCHLPYGPTAFFGVYNTVRPPQCPIFPFAVVHIFCRLLAAHCDNDSP